MEYAILQKINLCGYPFFLFINSTYNPIILRHFQQSFYDKYESRHYGRTECPVTSQYLIFIAFFVLCVQLVPPPSLPASRCTRLFAAPGLRFSPPALSGPSLPAPGTTPCQHRGCHGPWSRDPALPRQGGYAWHSQEAGSPLPPPIRRWMWHRRATCRGPKSGRPHLTRRGIVPLSGGSSLPPRSHFKYKLE